MSRSQANLILVLAAFLWGSGNAAQKLIAADLGPLMATGLRCLIAAAVVAPFALREKQRTVASSEKRLLLMAATVNFAAALTFYQLAFQFTSVTNAGFLVNTCSVMTPFAAWWILRAAPVAIVWPCAGMALGGIGAMSGIGSLATFTPNLGDICSLFSAGAYAIWMVLLGEYVRMHGGAARMSMLQFAISGAILVALGLLVETTTLAGLWNALPMLVFVAVFSTAGGYLLQAIAQQHTSASETAVIVSAEALFGAVAGYLVFGEQLAPLGYVGAGCIFVAIILVEVWEPVREKIRFAARTVLHASTRQPMSRRQKPSAYAIRSTMA